MTVEEQLQGLRGYVDEVQRTITVAEVLQAQRPSPADGPPPELMPEAVYAVERPSRRRPLAIAAAVFALVGLGIALVVRPGASPPVDPASPSTTVEGASSDPPRLLRGTDAVEEIGPGAYAIDADGSSRGPRFVFEIPESGWFSVGGLIGQGDPAVVGMSFGEIWNVHVDPCRNSLGLLSPPPGPSVDDLVAALVAMPGFLVTGEPEPVTVDGYPGTYLELTVDPTIDFATCDEGFFDSWVGPLDTRYHQAPGQVEQFWVLDVGGERVVVGAMHVPGAPADLLDQLDAVIGSVRIDVVP